MEFLLSHVNTSVASRQLSAWSSRILFAFEWVQKYYLHLNADRSGRFERWRKTPEQNCEGLSLQKTNRMVSAFRKRTLWRFQLAERYCQTTHGDEPRQISPAESVCTPILVVVRSASFYTVAHPHYLSWSGTGRWKSMWLPVIFSCVNYTRIFIANKCPKWWRNQ